MHDRDYITRLAALMFVDNTFSEAIATNAVKPSERRTHLTPGENVVVSKRVYPEYFFTTLAYGLQLVIMRSGFGELGYRFGS